jgi:hypothetical protein
MLMQTVICDSLPAYLMGWGPSEILPALGDPTDPLKLHNRSVTGERGDDEFDSYTGAQRSHCAVIPD